MNEQDSRKLSDYLNVEVNRAIWKNAIQSGNTFFIPPIVGKGFSIDEPVHEDGRHPLIDVVMHKPVDEKDAYAFADLAQCLINYDATLTQHDYKGLLPADYALISPNPYAAARIVLATLRHFASRIVPEQAYRPNLDALFITTPYERMRKTMYTKLLANCSEVRERFIEALQDGDPELYELAESERFFWENFVPPPRHMLRRAPDELVKQFNAVAFYDRSHRRTKDAPNAASDVGQALIKANVLLREDAKTVLRNIEWCITRDLRP